MTTSLRLLALLRPFSGWVALSVLLGAATIASGIGLLGTSAYLIATASLQPSIAVLQVAIVGVRFFGLSRGVFRYLERLVSHSVNFRLLSHLRVWFYRSIEPLAPAGLQSYRGGDVLARVIADIETLEHFYVRVVAPPLVALIVTLGVGWLVGMAHWGFAFILAGGLLISGLLLPFVTYRSSRSAGVQSVTARAELSAALVDGLQGAADLIAFRQGDAYLLQLEALSQAAARAQTKLAWRGAWANAATLLISNLTLWGVLFLGIVLAAEGGLDGVTLAVLALVTMASFEAVQPLGLAAQQLESSLKAGRRLFELADQKSAVIEARHPSAPPENGDISLLDVYFRYTPEIPWVLRGANLELLSGQRVALIGPSGSGKSTLLNLLIHFWEVERGEILLGGQNLRHLSGQTIRQSISLMAQDAYLFNTTLRQNLLLAKPDAAEDELWQALGQASLDKWARGLPDGLDTWVGEHAQKLSGGERQRLGIARLHLQNSTVVLLDEPSGHLDAITARQVRETLLRTTRGKTVIWVTHQRDGLEDFDRVLRLENGQIVEVNQLGRN